MTIELELSVSIIDLSRDPSMPVGRASSFTKGVNWAWGYLRGSGAVIDDDHEVLVIHSASGAYRVVAVGCIKSSGEDWILHCLTKDVETAAVALQRAEKELAARTLR